LGCSGDGIKARGDGVGTENFFLLGWGGDDGADVHFRVTLIKFVGAVGPY